MSYFWCFQVHGVFVKGDLTNPTEIIINESKQWTAGGVSLSGATATNPAQMTNAWIEKVRLELMNSGDAVKEELAKAIKKALDPMDPTILTKVVLTVDRTPAGNAGGFTGGIALIKVVEQ